MGSFTKKSSASNSKKKSGGPKGKKARAKAKLERQWGEQPKQEDLDNKRIGRSRLKKPERKQNKYDSHLQKRGQQQENQPISFYSKPRNQRLNGLNDDDSDNSSMASSASNTSHHSLTTPMQGLLSMIRKDKTAFKKKIKTSNDDDDLQNRMENDHDHYPEMENGDSDEDDESSTSANDVESDSDIDHDDSVNKMNIIIEEEEGDDNDDISIYGSPDGNSSKIDLFRQRFKRAPLQELELSNANKNKPKITKLPITNSMEMQLSTPFDGTDDLEYLMSTQTKEEWQKEAYDTFLSTNRKSLQHRWNHLRIKKLNKKNDNDKMSNQSVMNDIQSPIYTFLSRYCDMFITTLESNNKTSTKGEHDIHQLYLLHILNHVLTSQVRVIRNNRLLKEIENKKKRIDEAAIGSYNQGDNLLEMDDDTSDDRFRDQGFTRPTVLVLLPTRGTCYRFVKDLFRLLGCEMAKEPKERFETDYGMIVADEENEGQAKDDALEQRRKLILEKKGKEWNDLFGDNVNQDDDFKMGISINPMTSKGKMKNKTSTVSAKIYTDFFRSDIIVASPLGLKMLITPEGAEKEGNFDYLSSIEICLLKHSDVMLMQNWDHVNDILSLLNQEPRNNNDTDFSRVRSYLLEGQAAHWRQLILSSKFMDPSLISSFKRFGKSVSGSVKVRRKTHNEDAAISNVLIPIKQVFQKVPVSSFGQQSEARVDYFINTLLPQIQRYKQNHTLVYIPSYFDFCSLRNAFLKREDVTFVSVTEYSRTSEISRGRARFLQGRKPIMLYTGRAHYFHRHAIKGIQHLIFLGPPEHPDFYADHVNLIGDLGAATGKQRNDEEQDLITGDMSSKTCLVLFTKYEAHALERVVGSSNCSRMLSSPKTTFMFHS